MIRFAKLSVLRVLRAAGLYSFALRSRWRRERLVILCYHGVSIADEHEWDGALSRRLAKAPVELDRERAPGWLYFFRDLECTPDHRKIGCTDRPLDVRMEEWRSAHPHLELVQCWYVPFHAQWWETTIHQVLRGVRYMMDRETRTFERYDHKRRKGREIEWFSIRDAGGGEAYLLAICRTVVETLLRQLYKGKSQ